MLGGGRAPEVVESVADDIDKGRLADADGRRLGGTPVSAGDAAELGERDPPGDGLLTGLDSVVQG